jgi:hypothetical protein
MHDIHNLKYRGKTPLDYQYILNQKRNEGQEGKQISSWERGGHKERGNVGTCGGCILYPHMKK